MSCLPSFSPWVSGRVRGREWEWKERVHLRLTGDPCSASPWKSNSQLLKCPESSLMKSKNVNSNLSSPTRSRYCYNSFWNFDTRNTLTVSIYVYINPFIDEDDVIANLFWSALLRNLPLVILFNVHIKWHLQSACHLWKLFPQLLLPGSCVSFIPQFKCHFLQNGFPDCRVIWSTFSASMTTWLIYESSSQGW